MLDKAEKTARAALLIANRGYTEDAFILARSLVNLAIDLSYLSARDTDRFETYRAAGRVARRRVAEAADVAPVDEERIDWTSAEKRARLWQKPGAIKQRASKSGCTEIYERAYRHGSSYEHSDAWSLLTYESGQARTKQVVFHLTMLTIAYALAKTHAARQHVFGLTDAATTNAIEAHFLAAFLTKPRAAPAPGHPSHGATASP
jgi:uncharacterized protein DUF5677